MKRLLISMIAIGLCVAAFSSIGSAQNDAPKEADSATEKILRATGKVAAKTGKSALKLGAEGAKATAENVVLPAGKLLWDPVLTKSVPKVIGASVKLAGKGIRNGFKLIRRKDKTPDDPEPLRSTT